MRRLVLLLVFLLPVDVRAQEYAISAVRYATIEGFPLAGLLPDAPRSERVDIAMAFWVIESADRVVLFDTGFHRARWLERFEVSDFMRPDSAARLAGVHSDSVTDIIVSHAHWDHMGGIDLFPNATIWMQEEEYRYYTGPAWQPDGRSGGIDADDIRELVDRNLTGTVRLVAGDSVEILPGIVVLTGARHTFASQYVMVRGDPTYVLASDNAYLYTNLREGRAGATFLPNDREGNLAAIDRMLRLAGDADHVIPGHDPLPFERFPTRGRVAAIKGHE
jgi:glyoxylase-like metal-dependent hydrolase (beta-lactamase superfamily II)